MLYFPAVSFLRHTIMSPPLEIDQSSLPSIFQSSWKSNPDPTALPFPRDNPPFALTDIDWHQLSITDADFTPHSWENLYHLISTNQLDELKRWPSALKAYLAWTAHVKEKYGSVKTYLLEQRLFWKPLDDKAGVLKFEVRNQTPFADTEDYKILRNDWTYAFEPRIRHIVVWLKQRLPVDEEGALNDEGRSLVQEFVKTEFRRKVSEEEFGSRVIWFKNTTNLQSVRSLEHVHVLVKDVDESVLEPWLQ
ncbi:hypothetical protein GQ44DRAFT_824901 [Phaeosphaeriaceae sp. PMI808]|nr:hypothetical protein GQ44DRAFT_824901 [Phaeosphaeriaceae sp. PMI808]